MDEKAAGLPHAPSHVSLRAIVAAVGLMVGGVVVALAGAWIELGFAASPAGAPGTPSLRASWDPCSTARRRSSRKR